MFTLPALGSRPAPPFNQPAATQSGGDAARVAAGANPVTPAAGASGAAPDGATITLSSRGLAALAGQPGGGIAGAAQQFATDVAKALFGHAQVGFDTFSLSAEASMAAGAAQATGANIGASSLKPGENAHFIGTGQVVTAGGETCQFELEVSYQAGVQADSAQAAPRARGVARPDTLALNGRQLPAIEYPGSLEDLYKLLERTLQGSVSGSGSGAQGGNLALRLQRLVNSAALLAPRPANGEPQSTPADRSKAVANSYGSAPAGA